METFPALLAICAGEFNGSRWIPRKGQWRGALMFSLICVWINGWLNNREACDLRRYRAHYDVIVMSGVVVSSELVIWRERAPRKNLYLKNDVKSVILNRLHYDYDVQDLQTKVVHNLLTLKVIFGWHTRVKYAPKGFSNHYASITSYGLFVMINALRLSSMPLLLTWTKL